MWVACSLTSVTPPYRGRGGGGRRWRGCKLTANGTCGSFIFCFDDWEGDHRLPFNRVESLPSSLAMTLFQCSKLVCAALPVISHSKYAIFGAQLSLPTNHTHNHTHNSHSVSSQSLPDGLPRLSPNCHRSRQQEVPTAWQFVSPSTR